MWVSLVTVIPNHSFIKAFSGHLDQITDAPRTPLKSNDLDKCADDYAYSTF